MLKEGWEKEGYTGGDGNDKVNGIETDKEKERHLEREKGIDNMLSQCPWLEYPLYTFSFGGLFM